MAGWWGSSDPGKRLPPPRLTGRPELPALWWAAYYLAALLVVASLAGPGWRWISAGYHFHQSKRRREQDGTGHGGTSSDTALTKSLRARNRELLDVGNTLHRDHVALLARHKLEGAKWAAQREAAREENHKLRVVLEANLQEVERLKARNARDETESDSRHRQHVAPHNLEQKEQEKQREALEKNIRELEAQLEGAKAQSARAAAMEAELQRKDAEIASIRKESTALEARNRVLAMAVAMRKKEIAGAPVGAAAAGAPAGAVGDDQRHLEDYAHLLEEELEKLRRTHAEHVKQTMEAAPGLAGAREGLWKMLCEQLTKERGALQAQVQELQKQIGLVTADRQATKEGEAMQWAVEKAALERTIQEMKSRNLEAMQELEDKGRLERAALNKKIERLSANVLASTKAKKLWEWEKTKFERRLKDATTVLEETKRGNSTAQALVDENDAIRKQWAEDEAKLDKKQNEMKAVQEQLTNVQAQLKGASVAQKTLANEKEWVRKGWAVDKAELERKQEQLKVMQEQLDAATQKQLQDTIAKAALAVQLEETEAMDKREKDAYRQELEKARAAMQAKVEECAGLGEVAERLLRELGEMQAMVQTKLEQVPSEWQKDKVALEDTVRQLHLQLGKLMQERQAAATAQNRWEEERAQLMRKVGDTIAVSEGAKRVHFAEKDATIKAWSQKQALWLEERTANQRRLSALEQKNTDLQFEAQQHKNEKARWAGEIQHLQKAKIEARGWYERAELLNEVNTKLQAKLDVALVEKKALMDENVKHTQELEKVTSASQSWFGKTDRLQGEKTKVQALLDDVLNKNKVLENEKDAIRKEWAEDKAEMDKKQIEMKAVQEQLTNVQAQLKGALVAHKALTDEKDAIRKQWAVERAELNRKQKELKVVQEKLDAASQRQLQDTFANVALEAQLGEMEAMGKREKDAHRQELEEARAVTQAKTKECAALSQEAGRLRRELGEMQAMVQTKGDQWSVLDKLNRQLAAELDELKAALGEKEAITYASEAISKELKTALKMLSERNTECLALREEKERQRVKIRAEMESNVALRKTIKQVRAELRATKAEAEAKQREDYHELAGAKSTIRVLEGDKAAFEVLRHEYESRDRSMLALKDELIATQRDNTEMRRGNTNLEEILAEMEAQADIATKDELEEVMKALEKTKKEKTTLEKALEDEKGRLHILQNYTQTLEAQKKQDGETAARALEAATRNGQVKLEQAIEEKKNAVAAVRATVVLEVEEQIKELGRMCAGHLQDMVILGNENEMLEYRLHLLRRRKQLLAEDRERVTACAAAEVDRLRAALHAAGGEWSDAQEETAGAGMTAAMISGLARDFI